MYDDDKLHDLNNKETKDIQRFSWLLQKLHNSFRRGTCSHQNWWRSSLLSKTEKMVTYDYHHLIFQQHIVMLLRITSKWTHQTTKVISIILKKKKEKSFCLLFVLLLIAYHLKLLWRRDETRSKHLITHSVKQKFNKTVNYFDVNNS